MTSKPSNDLIAPLCEAWPKAFTTGTPRPLKLGIHLDMAADGRFTADEIRVLLRIYVGRPRYLQALTSGAYRINLDGQRVPPVRVTCEEEAHAKERLAKLDAAKAAKAAKTAKHVRLVRNVVETKADNVTLASSPAPAGTVNPLTGRVVLGLRRS